MGDNMDEPKSTDGDRTTTDRQRRRREKLDRAAKRMGFNSWSAYETFVINQEADWYTEIDELMKPDTQ